MTKRTKRLAGAICIVAAQAIPFVDTLHFLLFCGCLIVGFSLLWDE